MQVGVRRRQLASATTWETPEISEIKVGLAANPNPFPQNPQRTTGPCAAPTRFPTRAVPDRLRFATPSIIVCVSSDVTTPAQHLHLCTSNA